MEENPVLLDATRAGLAVVTLNRPAVHNALNMDVIEALADIFDELKGADGVRCVILEGAGDSFCAGGDIAWMRFEGDYTFNDRVDNAKTTQRMLAALRALHQPTIALVHGAAVGTGAALVAATDIALADRSARFSFPEVRVGLIQGVIAPYLVEAIGARAARRYFLTGESFDAEEARRLGLVHQVAADKQALASMSEQLVGAIYGGAPGAIAAAKEVLTLVDHVAWDQHLFADLARRIAERRESEEGREGFAAFMEKRKPRWAE